MILSKGFTLRSILSSFSVIIFLSNMSSVQAFEINNNIGAGIGVPYGFFGGNYELEINVADSFAIAPSIGFGSSLLAGSASSVGLRLHFGDKDGLFRFGLAYWDGTNTIVETGFDQYATEDGTTVGINLRFQFGRTRSNGLDVSILKIVTPTEDEIRSKYFVGDKQGGDIKVSVGYVHRF